MSRNIYFVVAQCILISQLTQSLVLLTASMSDIKKLASKFVSNEMADKVAEFLINIMSDMNTRAKDTGDDKNAETGRAKPKNFVTDVILPVLNIVSPINSDVSKSSSKQQRFKTITRKEHYYSFKEKATSKKQGEASRENNQDDRGDNDKDLKTSNFYAIQQRNHQDSKDSKLETLNGIKPGRLQHPIRHPVKPSGSIYGAVKNRVPDEKPQRHQGKRIHKQPLHSDERRNKKATINLILVNRRDTNKSYVTEFEKTMTVTPKKEKTEFDQYDNNIQLKSQQDYIATSGPVALPRVHTEKPWSENEYTEGVQRADEENEFLES